MFNNCIILVKSVKDMCSYVLDSRKIHFNNRRFVSCFQISREYGNRYKYVFI